MTDGPKSDPTIKTYTGPAGGWGSAKSVGEILVREHVAAKGSTVLMHQNKPDGYMCVSCAWAKPAKTHPLEYCENGAKATAWEVTDRRADHAFFAEHTLSELETWRDHDLEEQGRLTHPMRWDPDSDAYVPVTWEAAFEEIGRELRATSTAGRRVLHLRAALRSKRPTCTSCSRACSAPTTCPTAPTCATRARRWRFPESIGASVGTAILSDFQNTDCIFYIAQNVGTSSPRMLHDLQDAVERGVKIVTFNPLRERGLERFVNPQAPSADADRQGDADLLGILPGQKWW